MDYYKVFGQLRIIQFVINQNIVMCNQIRLDIIIGSQ